MPAERAPAPSCKKAAEVDPAACNRTAKMRSAPARSAALSMNLIEHRTVLVRLHLGMERPF
jgi:hypothetical protein